MDAHHASLVRRTLEEICQKRAAERSHKSSSGSESESQNSYGMHSSESASRMGERETYALLSRGKELENISTDLLKDNSKLLSQIEAREVEKDSLLKRLNDIEQNSLPSLRKVLKDVTYEKDAAIVTKEDALSQLRTIKKQLKEAEEEQYRAEEDAAALRAELNSSQQQSMGNPFFGISSTRDLEEKVLAMEKETVELKSELQRESMLRQQEHNKLAEEQLRLSTLTAEKQDLEDKLVSLSQKISKEASDAAARNTFSMKDKAKYEEQLHDMAVMVERLESGRQKLLVEIDSQSSEIERLFEENSSLLSSYQDALGAAGQWEKQVKNCLEQNEELRSLLDKLRSELVNLLKSSASKMLYMQAEQNVEKVSDPRGSMAEIHFLKDQLAKEQTLSEALAAEVLKLSAELRRATQAYNFLTRLYRPVIRSIEDNLMKIKQESYITVQ